MQRVLTVTYGYLKFTFASMLAATVLFTLTSLAITSLRTFFLVVVVGVLIFLLARGEFQTKRRHDELRKRQNCEDLQTALFILALAKRRPPGQESKPVQLVPQPIAPTTTHGANSPAVGSIGSIGAGAQVHVGSSTSQIPITKSGPLLG